jgi:hypothetical protein
MGTHTRDERCSQYDNASLEVRELYTSDELELALKSVSGRFGERYGDFVNLIGDVVLGLERGDGVYTELTTAYGLTPGVAENTIETIIRRVNSAYLSLPFPGSTTPQGAVESVLDAPGPTLTKMGSSSAPAYPPIGRVMPKEEGQSGFIQDPRAETELPNALLKNLKASLMHSGSEPEATNPLPSYNTLIPKTPTLPQPPEPPIGGTR